MSKGLEKIVASLELCKLIPAGEFEDTVFAWRYPTYDERNRRLLSKWHIIEVNWDAVKEYKKKYDERFFPAPTLEEILDEMVSFRASFCVHGMAIGNNFYGYPTSAEEALRLWFKVKGIEVE